VQDIRPTISASRSLLPLAVTCEAARSDFTDRGTGRVAPRRRSERPGDVAGDIGDQARAALEPFMQPPLKQAA